MKWASWLVVCVALVSCATPMSQKETAGLTRCYVASIAALRKSLVRHGYRVLSSSDREIVTDYKTLSIYDGATWARRIRVQRISSRAFQFQVHYRRETLATRASKEWDEDYIEEERPVHEATQREVCG